MKKYAAEKEISAVVRAFEAATISRTEWKHAEHLTIALYYLTRHDYKTAYEKMRGGIFNLLRAFEVNFSVEMPYHETLTVFWLRTIDGFRQTKNDPSGVEIYNEMMETFDKDYPLKFYSRELLFSDEARRAFKTPDRQ